MRDWAVICDLDGTISDDRHRRHLIPDWEAYHSFCGSDAMVTETMHSLVDDVTGLMMLQTADLIFVTGRPESYRHVTDQWLTAKVPVGLDYCLLMRPDTDNTPSAALKVDLLNKYFETVRGTALAGWYCVRSAFDDRSDVLALYPIAPDRKRFVPLPYNPPVTHSTVTAADVLSSMSRTYGERNVVYKDNYKRVAPIMKILWPNGIPQSLVTEDRWHLFELLIVKITRFAVSGLVHSDSIHDAAVYAAMIEADLKEHS